MNDWLSLLLPSELIAGAWEFGVKLRNSGELDNEIPGSAIRDGLGRGLHQLGSCQESPGCQCPYCTYFKPATPPGQPGGTAPGFVIETTGFTSSPREGDRALVRLVMIGRAVAAYPWFAAALLHCGQVGIGDPRAAFKADLVKGPLQMNFASLDAAAADLRAVRDCTIQLAPFILRVRGSELETVSFPRLLKAIAERLQPNVARWCDCEIPRRRRDEIIDEMTKRAECLEWREQKGIPARGVARKNDGRVLRVEAQMCSLEVKGDLTDFWRLLMVGAALHIGENPTIGLGKYSINVGSEQRNVAPYLFG